jgi:lysophospholipase L1-like esterase
MIFGPPILRPGIFRHAFGVGRIASPTALHPLAAAYVAALGSSPSAIPRISRAFRILDDAGLLNVLVDGAYYGTDGNLSTGNPISLRGVAAAAMTGSLTRGRYGLTADQSDVQGIGHNIAATNSGTFLVDETPLIPSSGFASFSPIISIGTTAPTTSSHQYGYALTSVPRIQSFNDAGSYVNDSPYSNAGATSGSRLIDPQSWRSSIHGANYGYASHRAWINGVRSDLVGSTFAAATAANKTRVSLFRRPANGTTFSNPASPKIQYVGTITSWMLFARELSNTEASAATRAMTVLRGNSKALIVEGDSLTDAIFGATPVRSRDNWAYAVTQNSAWSDHLLINAAASGHQVSGMVSSENFTTQCLAFMPRDFISEAVYALAGGINDFGASGATTAAAVYANLRTLVDLAKANGARTVLATIPTPATSWTSLNSGANGTRLAALNTLIRNGHASGHFDVLVDANAAVPAYDVDATKWQDTVHPNAAGNALWAAAFLAAVA